MKFHPIQLVGLGAILIFGGYLAFTLIKGPRDPDLPPSGVRLSDLPPVSVDFPEPPLPADLLAVGSQDAKDDLYCSGVVFGAALDSTDAANGVKLGDIYAALAEGGRAKLIAEGVVKEAGAIAVGNAWSDKGRADIKAKTTKIALEDCLKRPAALKPPADASSTTPAPDLLSLGSQDARDDLYCSGLIYAEHMGDKTIAAEQSVKQLTAILALAESGTKKLVSEGAAVEGSDLVNRAPGKATTAMAANAHTDKAQADFDAKKPRIPVAACMARAAALKPN